MPNTRADAFAEALDLISRAEARIQENEGDAPAETRTLKAHLISLLEVCERDPDLEVAADELYAAAFAFARAVEGEGVTMQQRRILSEALIRFQDRVPSARDALGPIAGG